MTEDQEQDILTESLMGLSKKKRGKKEKKDIIINTYVENIIEQS